MTAGTTRVRWGVLGTASIGTRQVIPATQGGAHSLVAGIASRDRERAQAVASQFGIERAYGSYDELLADAGVDAVYIPLPNHLHVPWSVRALEAGKHVLCEKPIGLNAAEAETLAAASERHPRLKVMEAFMYRFHPQWQRARQLVTARAIGEVRAIHTWFAYFNVDPGNIRNMKDIGGGALMDIGCYGVSLSRFLFAREPRRVAAVSEHDPSFGTDWLTSATMDFGGAVATVICATQLAHHQRVEIVGTEGRVEIEIPFNAPPDRPCRIWLHRRGEADEILVEPANQYTIQADLFSRAVLEDTRVPTPLDDAVANMRVIDAVKAGAASGAWVGLP